VPPSANEQRGRERDWEREGERERLEKMALAYNLTPKTVNAVPRTAAPNGTPT